MSAFIVDVLKDIFHGLLEGVAIAAGIAWGVTRIFKMTASREDKVFTEDTAEGLLNAFQTYRDKLEEEEDYKHIAQVQQIIAELERGKIPDQVYEYAIKTDTSFGLDDRHEGKRLVRVVKTYTVTGKAEKPRRRKN